MELINLVEIVKEQGKGVRAYEEFARQARRNIDEKPDFAAANFLLAVAAERFVDAYHDRPLLTQIAEQEFDRYANFVDQLESAIGNKDCENHIQVLNAIARQIYENRS